MNNNSPTSTCVIAIDDGTSYGQCAVQYATIITQIFKSTLFVAFHSRQFNKKTFFEEAEKNSALMIVIGVSQKRNNSLFNVNRALSFMKDVRIPVLVVGNQMPNENCFKSVILAIDTERQTKEKAMWAGYFNRFNNANIHILKPSYKEKILYDKVENNVEFVEKLYKNLEIVYQIHVMDAKIDNIDSFSLSFAPSVDASITVIMLTKFYSFIDFLFSPKEKSLMIQANGFPLLCLNERSDLCVLCT